MQSKTLLYGVALVAALGVAPRASGAQGVSGTTIGAPDPGRFAASFDIGVVGIQMPRFRYGDTYTALALGVPSTGSIFDERNRQGALAPALAFGWGVPGGLFGQQAEVFGQFAFARATESGTFGQPSGVLAFTIPFVNTATLMGTPVTGLSGPVDPANVPSFERTFVSYDGQIGARVHVRRAGWSFSPGVYLGFQRTDLDESVTMSLSPPVSFNLNSSVSSDYYQIGIALGATYNLTQQVALFGLVQGGLDYVRARYDGQSGVAGSLVATAAAAASDRDDRVSGRVGARAGLAFSPTPAVTISVAGLMQYIGSVSSVVYPSHSPLVSSIPSNGSVPARLGSEGQLNFGGAIGATLRF